MCFETEVVNSSGFCNDMLPYVVLCYVTDYLLTHLKFTQVM